MDSPVTLALTARCSATGQLGFGFASSHLPSSTLTTQTNILVGQSLQTASPFPLLDRKILGQLTKHIAPDKALSTLLTELPEHKSTLQILVLDINGRTAAHTGKKLKSQDPTSTAGHLTKDNLAVAGQGLSSLEGLERIARQFGACLTPDAILSDRIICSLETGLEAFGKRTSDLTSAALQVTGEDHYPLIDLRIDHRTRPVERLRQTYDDYMIEDIRHDALLPTIDHPYGILPTQWGETKRFARRHLREARRQWQQRFGGNTQQ